jgi:hypothetical protein
MVKPGASGARPRSLTGGYSERYEERHAARGATRRYAPEWTAAAAGRLHELLKQDAEAQRLGLYLNTLMILLDGDRGRKLVAAGARNRGLSKPDERLALAQLAHYGQRAEEACKGMDPEKTHVNDAAKAVLHSLFKTLRSRSKLMAAVVRPLVVEPVTYGPRTFHGWLSAQPELERHRRKDKCRRIDEGLARWCPRWFQKPVVVCYEIG